MFYGHQFSLGKSGNLIGRYLEAKHSGTYQCFVRDQVTGFQVFSRKLKVAVTGRNLLYFYYHILATGMMPAEGNSHYLQLASWTRVFFLSFFLFIYYFFWKIHPFRVCYLGTALPDWIVINNGLSLRMDRSGRPVLTKSKRL